MPLVLGGVAASIRLSVKYRTKSRGRWEFFIIFRAKPDGGYEAAEARSKIVTKHSRIVLIGEINAHFRTYNSYG